GGAGRSADDRLRRSGSVAGAGEGRARVQPAPRGAPGQAARRELATSLDAEQLPEPLGVLHGKARPVVVEVAVHLGVPPPPGDPAGPALDLRRRVVAV